MQKRELLKRLLMLALAGLLVFTVLPAMAQDDEGAEGDTTEQVEEDHSEDAEDHSEDAADDGHAADEAEGAVSPLEPLGINGGLLIVQIVNFILVAVLLTAILWNPARNMMDNRATEIAKGLEDASIAASARQNAETEAEKIMADARAEVAKSLEEARGRGDEVAKGIETDARSEAERIREEAQTDAASARDAELAGVRDQVLSIANAMTRRLIGETLDTGKQQQLVADFLTKLPEDAKSMTGDVEVVSAMPLTDDEQSRVTGELSASNVTFTVNPDILGGLIVRGSDRVVDGSVRSGLNDLSDS
ncbi:MAG: F0F1 ATP synthase subunit B, partial [Aggregatilineales bacterium]